MAAAQVPVYQRQGFVERAFGNPTGVAASNAEIFVADPTSGHEKITVLNLKLEDVRDFPTVVQDGRKIRPEDVALDGEGNLWVVGTTTHDETATTCEFAVQYTMARDGSYVRLRQIDLPKSALAKGIAVDTTSNHILVAQSMYPRSLSISSLRHSSPPPSFIGVYKEDGTPVLERSVQQREGTRNKQQYLAVDRNGNILVSDEVKNCISVYKDRRLLREVGGKEVQVLHDRGGRVREEVIFSGLNDPRGICIDRAGNIIVADYGNSRVVLFDNTYKFRQTLVPNIKPQAVAVTVPHAGQVKLVVTSLHNKVFIFEFDLRYL